MLGTVGLPWDRAWGAGRAVTPHHLSRRCPWQGEEQGPASWQPARTQADPQLSTTPWAGVAPPAGPPWHLCTRPAWASRPPLGAWAEATLNKQTKKHERLSKLLRMIVRPAENVSCLPLLLGLWCRLGLGRGRAGWEGTGQRQGGAGRGGAGAGLSAWEREAPGRRASTDHRSVPTGH